MCYASGGSGGPRMARLNAPPLYSGLPKPGVGWGGIKQAMANRAEVGRRLTSPSSEFVQRGSVRQKPLTPQETEQQRSEQAAWASRERTGEDPYSIAPQSRQAKIAKQSPQARMFLAGRGGAAGVIRGR